MLFWIFVIILVVGIVWHALDEWSIWYPVPVAIGLVGIIISVIVLIFSYVGLDGQIAKCYARYDSLVYQYENDVYENDNDLGKRELITDIQEWNEDLAFYQKAQDDFWIGIYIPNIFDEFEFIELDK